MSNLVHFEYAPPKSWEQFEDLCADLFSEMWCDPNSVRYGRAGQAQNGVDILISNASVFPIGLQCKKKSIWPAKKLKFSEVLDELDKAEKFSPKLEQYYILTTAESDAKLVSQLAELNINRNKEKKFKITIFFWSDIVSRIALYEKVINKHFNIGSKHGIYTPLISTWYVNDGEIELDNQAWKLAVKETSVDFLDYPNGYIVIRQRETDKMLEKIKIFKKDNKNEVREELYELKKSLQRVLLKEKEVANFIKQIFLSKKILESIVDIEFDPKRYYLHEVIAEIIKIKFSKKNIYEEFKIFLSPPKANEWSETADHKFRDLVLRAGYSEIPIHLPSNIYMKIHEIEDSFKLKYNNNMPKIVLELSNDIKGKYILPRIILILFEIMEKSGRDMGALEKSGFLDLNNWSFFY